MEWRIGEPVICDERLAGTVERNILGLHVYYSAEEVHVHIKIGGSLYWVAEKELTKVKPTRIR